LYQVLSMSWTAFSYVLMRVLPKQQHTVSCECIHTKIQRHLAYCRLHKAMEERCNLWTLQPQLPCCGSPVDSITEHPLLAHLMQRSRSSLHNFLVQCTSNKSWRTYQAQRVTFRVKWRWESIRSLHEINFKYPMLLHSIMTSCPTVISHQIQACLPCKVFATSRSRQH
jgi:hypothetical protein